MATPIEQIEYDKMPNKKAKSDVCGHGLLKREKHSNNGGRRSTSAPLIARSFIEYVLSYLIISSRSFFCLDIFFSFNQNVAES